MSDSSTDLNPTVGESEGGAKPAVGGEPAASADPGAAAGGPDAASQGDEEHGAPRAGAEHDGHEHDGHEHDGHGHGHGDHAHDDHHLDDVHRENPMLAHHYDTPAHQFEAGKLGIWLFLVTEILFFSGLFCAYAIYRSLNPEVFVWAHYYLDTTLGAVNTGVLIVSSLTAALAVRAAQLGQSRALQGYIVATILCAFGFLGIKYVEYAHKFHEGLVWVGRDGGSVRFAPHHDVWELEEFQHKHPEAAAAARRLLGQPEGAHGAAAAHGDGHAAPSTTASSATAASASGDAHATTGDASAASAAPAASASSADSAAAAGSAHSADSAAPAASAAGSADAASSASPDALALEAPPAAPASASLPAADKPAKPLSERERALAALARAKAKEPGAAEPKSGAEPPASASAAVASAAPASAASASAASASAASASAASASAAPASSSEHLAEAPAAPSASAVAVADTSAPAASSAAPLPTAVTFVAAPVPAAAPPAAINPADLSPLRQLTEAEAVPLLAAGVLGPKAASEFVPSRPRNAPVFFGIYFAMTGLHGIHVIGGIVVWLMMLHWARKGAFGPKHFGPIDYTALYWHVVDLVWIFLFPLLYLIH